MNEKRQKKTTPQTNMLDPYGEGRSTTTPQNCYNFCWMRIYAYRIPTCVTPGADDGHGDTQVDDVTKLTTFCVAARPDTFSSE